MIDVTFALRLPRPGAPLVHLRAMQLQCGGLRALAQVMEAAPDDVHQLVRAAGARWGDLGDAPWDRIVPAIAGWQAHRRARPR